jgi:hypothetical protein
MWILLDIERGGADINIQRFVTFKGTVFTRPKSTRKPFLIQETAMNIVEPASGVSYLYGNFHKGGVQRLQ